MSPKFRRALKEVMRERVISGVYIPIKVDKQAEETVEEYLKWKEKHPTEWAEERLKIADLLKDVINTSKDVTDNIFLTNKNK